MRIFILLFLTLLFVAQNPAQCRTDKAKKGKVQGAMVKPADEFDKLPDGAKPDDDVRILVKDDQGTVVSSEIITVKEQLTRLGAGYLNGVLVDKDGKEIRFYKRMTRGASEGFEADRRFSESEDKRLADLKEQFTVIEIYVNPLKIS